MARPRSFDPDEVLDIARDVFWRKGFQATSLDEITAASGMRNPASMPLSATNTPSS